MIDMYQELEINSEDSSHEYVERLATSVKLRVNLEFLISFVDFYTTENRARRIDNMDATVEGNFSKLYELADTMTTISKNYHEWLEWNDD